MKMMKPRGRRYDHGDPHLLPEGHLRDIVGGRLFGEDAAPDDDVDEIKAGHDYPRQYARDEELPHVDIGEAREHDGKGVRRDEGIDRADAHKRPEAHVLAVSPVSASQGAGWRPEARTSLSWNRYRAPIITPMMTARMESLPGSLPSHLSRTFTASSPRPVWNISSPMRMKKGTGRSVKVVIDVKAPVTTPTRPGRPAKEENRRLPC